jgi:hypothetical protein
MIAAVIPVMLHRRHEYSQDIDGTQRVTNTTAQRRWTHRSSVLAV